jgi:hypothetical protein
MVYGAPVSPHRVCRRFALSSALLRRFLVLALPLLVLAMALFDFAGKTLGWLPREGQAWGGAAGGTVPVFPAWVAFGTWCLEALALSILFLLLAPTLGERRWLHGLLTGWIAWVFRGPLLVLAAASLGGLPPGSWWTLSFAWWGLYSLCGLLLSSVAPVLPDSAIAGPDPAVAEPDPAGAGIAEASDS